VRLRPVLPHEEAEMSESAACVEVESEVQRVVLKKNHWDTEPYSFDNSFPGTTSQRRMYEEFCMPVVESVLKGYNGTVMAYGQTGTGKTHTLGNLGHADASQRGIVLRSMEHVLQHVRDDVGSSYKITLSYLQLYMECILDLLEPSKDQLSLTEDPHTGEMSCVGAKVVEVANIEGLLEILRMGENNRVVANQRLNATSSRSHSMLMINIHRLPKQADGVSLVDSVTVTKGKLLLVDLAGSERISKSGSEGQTLEEAKFINLSLTALGKCINALSEHNAAHIPYRDSKLTRLMKDSFGGTARTSLIICLSPLRSHMSETTSALQFGLRAMKIENNTKIREEVDLRLLNYRLQAELDKTNNLYEVTLSSLEEVAKEAAEDRKQRELMELKLNAAEQQILAEKSIQEKIQQQYRQLMADKEEQLRQEFDESLASVSEQKDGAEKKLKEAEGELERLRGAATEAQRAWDKERAQAAASLEATKEAAAAEAARRKTRSEQELDHMQKQIQAKDVLIEQLQAAMTSTSEQKDQAHGAVLAEARAEVKSLKQELAETREQHDSAVGSERERSSGLEGEVATLRRQLEEQTALAKEAQAKSTAAAAAMAAAQEEHEDLRKFKSKMSQPKSKSNGLEKLSSSSSLGWDDASGQRGAGPPPASGAGVWNQHRDAVSAVSKLFEHVGLTTVFGLLKYDDRDVRLHAVKVIANLAAEEENQVNIVQEGGLEALFELLSTCTDEMTLRVAAGAIANLAMSEVNQHPIVEEGGLELLVKLSQTAMDSQTQRMIAGAIANLCGNANILDKLHASGSLQVLVNMSYSEHVDVLSQVARGFANNSKCTKGKTHLVELGAMPAIMHLASKKALTTVRKHAMLALCQIASCPANVAAVCSSGAFKVLKEIANSPVDEFKQMAATVVSNPIYK